MNTYRYLVCIFERLSCDILGSAQKYSFYYYYFLSRLTVSCLRGCVCSISAHSSQAGSTRTRSGKFTYQDTLSVLLLLIYCCMQTHSKFNLNMKMTPAHSPTEVYFNLFNGNNFFFMFLLN